MKKSYLFPSYFRIIGWVLFIPTAILFIYQLINEKSNISLSLNVPMITLTNSGLLSGDHKLISTVDIIPTLMIVLAAIGLLFIAFAANSQEDEYVESVRCRDLVWSVKASYLILIISSLLIYGGAFWTFIWVNMFAVLILFIIKFHISLYSLSKNNEDEK